MHGIRPPGVCGPLAASLPLIAPSRSARREGGEHEGRGGGCPTAGLRASTLAAPLTGNSGDAGPAFRPELATGACAVVQRIAGRFPVSTPRRVFRSRGPGGRGDGSYVRATAVAAVSCRWPWVWSAAVAVRNRLYPAAAQVGVLSRHCEDARLVWNLAVEQQSWWWPGRGAAPGSAERQRQLAAARAAEPWLAEGSSAVQQQALRDFDQAMAAFFRPDRTGGQTEVPQ